MNVSCFIIDEVNLEKSFATKSENTDMKNSVWNLVSGACSSHESQDIIATCCAEALFISTNVVGVWMYSIL